MSKNSNRLEKNFIEKEFKSLDRKLICPNEDCKELGVHFRCYDLSFEDCDVYLRWKEQYQKENNLKF